MTKKGHGLPFNLNTFSRMQFIVSFLIFTIFPVKKVPTANELLVSAKQIIIYHIARPQYRRKHEV